LVLVKPVTLLTAGGVSPFSEYTRVYMSGDQTTRISVGNHVEFDSIIHKGAATANAISVSTGVDQANGIITVGGTRRYLMIWNAYTTTNEGYEIAQWTDTLGAIIAEETGLDTPLALKRRDTGSNNDNNMNIVGQSIIDTSGGDIVMECRWTAFVGAPHRVRMQVTYYPLGAVI
jgi:hypothetical protein